MTPIYASKITVQKSLFECDNSCNVGVLVGGNERIRNCLVHAVNDQKWYAEITWDWQGGEKCLKPFLNYVESDQFNGLQLNMGSDFVYVQSFLCFHF